MSFLNPIWLLALPLILLPILIHLWNQRRHKIIQWGAMQFLISAKRMSRGMARLRHWLIMAARMLAIAGLIFLVTRPLSTGWLGMLSGGKPETVIILLDRSASMQQQSSLAGQSKLRAGAEKIVATLNTLGSDFRIYLLDPFSKSTGNRLIQLQRAQDLLDLPASSPTDASVDIPAMLQTTLDFITANQTGRTDVWVLSDSAENDWLPETSRWQAIRSGFSELEGVRFHVLNDRQPARENLSIRVDRWERSMQDSQPVLLLDISIRRSPSTVAAPTDVPISINIGGIRSRVNVRLESDSARLVGHRIPLDQESTAGWGSVELPSDSNPSDDQYYFAYSEPVPYQTTIVAMQSESIRGMELAAGVPAQREATATVVKLTPERISEIDWDRTTLLIWQADLPAGDVAKQVDRFIASGRTVIFLPPLEPTAVSFRGWSWVAWEQSSSGGAKVGYWNNDTDAWMQTRDGQSLPIDELVVHQYCRMQGTGRILAKLDNSTALLVRSTETGGAVYALATLPNTAYSSLDRDAIALYVFVQRALLSAADSQGAAKLFDAGATAAGVAANRGVLAHRPSAWDSAPGLAEMNPFRAGIYGNDQELIALNRPLAEEQPSPLADEALSKLFDGLDVHLVSESVTNDQSLASEIWKLFVVLVLVSLLAEAMLSMPERVSLAQVPTSSANRGRAAA